MVIAMAIACVTTSIAVSIATTKILAAYYFKIVDSYVDEMCKETRRFINIPNGKKGWRKIHCPICGDMCWKRPEDEALILYNGLNGAACTRCALKMGGDAS